jgi:hypothetical protein
MKVIPVWGKEFEKGRDGPVEKGRVGLLGWLAIRKDYDRINGVATGTAARND